MSILTTQTLSNFSHHQHSTCQCLRPDSDNELRVSLTQLAPKNILPRGSGLSYNDCCFNTDGIVIDTTRLNRFLSFDEATNILVCEPGVTFRDLFLFNPNYIPPVIPGTLYATLAGGVANDVHGKNQSHQGSLGEHIAWLELLIGDKCIVTSPTQHPDLFYATIGGLGLTGIISKIAVKMVKKSHWVCVNKHTVTTLPALLEAFKKQDTDYKVAWLDLLNPFFAIISKAHHVDPADTPQDVGGLERVLLSCPKLPFSLIYRGTHRLFNRIYQNVGAKSSKIMPLWQFNNPLDKLGQWQRAYGPKGLIQFQGLIPDLDAELTLKALFDVIKSHGALPTLAVLKRFEKPGVGLLSFARPGFTLAIDFKHNDAAINAVKAMNDLITSVNGNIYLAKDQQLKPAQFELLYPKHQAFRNVLKHYQSPHHSDLAKRLGLL